MTLEAATFKGGPLDRVTLRLPLGAWTPVLWEAGAVGGHYTRWAFLHEGFSLVPGIEGSPEATHLYEWEAAA